MSRTDKDTPYHVVVSRLTASDGIADHDHVFRSYYRDLPVTDSEGNFLYEEVEVIRSYSTHSSYARAVSNPIPYHRIPFIPKSVAHNKPVWVESETGWYGIYREIKVRTVVEKVVTQRTKVTPYSECTIDIPVTKDTLYLQPCSYFPAEEKERRFRFSGNKKKQRKQKVNHMNRSRSRQQLRSIKNFNDIEDYADVDYLDYVIKRRNDYLL